MKAKHFRKYIIRAILKEYDCWSENAEELMMMTGVSETGLLDENVKQKGGGPARGYFQMEPWVCDDLIVNRLANNPDRQLILRDMSITSMQSLKKDIVFMVLTCRYFYMEVPEPLPHHGDKDGIYEYYKKHWNTEEGKATRKHFFEMWEKYGDKE